MKISQNVTHGSVVVWRGDKLILASKRSKKIVGVFNFKSVIGGFTLRGEKFRVEIPQGIRTYGEASARIGRTS